jgi:hypothetical protein
MQRGFIAHEVARAIMSRLHGPMSTPMRSGESSRRSPVRSSLGEGRESGTSPSRPSRQKQPWARSRCTLRTTAVRKRCRSGSQQQHPQEQFGTNRRSASSASGAKQRENVAQELIERCRLIELPLNHNRSLHSRLRMWAGSACTP